MVQILHRTIVQAYLIIGYNILMWNNAIPIHTSNYLLNLIKLMLANIFYKGVIQLELKNTHVEQNMFT